MKTRTYLLLMLAAIIIPVACLSLAGLYMLLQVERESRLRSIQEMAQSTSLLIDSEIAVAEASIRNVANSHGIRTDDFERLHKLLSATKTSPLTWTLISDYEGRPLMNTFLPYGAPLPDVTGTWAAAVYDKQQTQVSGYFVGTLAKHGLVSVNVPVPAAVGKKYVVTQIFDPQYFNKVFLRSAIGRNWIVGVFDANGISIARNKNAEKLVGERVRPELFAGSRHRESGLIKHATREGVDVYDMFVRSKLTGWTVAIGVPVDEIESAARMATWYAALALAGVLSGACGIAVFFGRKIDRSLREAEFAAHRLSEGAVTAASHSGLKEVDSLLDVLHQTGLDLAKESAARIALTRERETLLEAERSARKQAEAQSTAKDNFISMLSHELRNPLAAIAAAVHVVRLPNLPAQKTDKAWEIVTRQLQHLSKIVEDLLDARRVMSGKVTLERAAVNVGDIVRFCCESMMVGARKKHEWVIATDDGWVSGDRTRLEQVIGNLLVNAVKYTPEGGRISVNTDIIDATVLVRIADTGIGMSTDVLPTIFDVLTQGPTTIDRSQGGLGLGLSIARELVHMHDGSITAHSQGIGQGSTFVVSLPACGELAGSGGRPACPLPT
jgi:signal transduction histidine kinase